MVLVDVEWVDMEAGRVVGETRLKLETRHRCRGACKTRVDADELDVFGTVIERVDVMDDVDSH